MKANTLKCSKLETDIKYAGVKNQWGGYQKGLGILNEAKRCFEELIDQSPAVNEVPLSVYKRDLAEVLVLMGHLASALRASEDGIQIAVSRTDEVEKRCCLTGRGDVRIIRGEMRYRHSANASWLITRHRN